ALDYLRSAGVRPDARVEEAVATVLERRQSDGHWLLDVRHRNTLHEELAGIVGAPNRWITLRALRVLDWYARTFQLRFHRGKDETGEHAQTAAKKREASRSTLGRLR